VIPDCFAADPNNTADAPSYSGAVDFFWLRLPELLRMAPGLPTDLFVGSIKTHAACRPQAAHTGVNLRRRATSVPTKPRLRSPRISGSGTDVGPFSSVAPTGPVLPVLPTMSATK